MRVDRIKVSPRAELSTQDGKIAAKTASGRDTRADLRQLRIARTIDMQSVSDLLARLPGKERVAAESWRCERKPRTGRHDAGSHDAAFRQLSQAGFDENPVLGPYLADPTS
jgi:hypothetical protein